jgi:molybdopterin-guanine dinucleotide biosynthesis protein A
MEIHQKHAKLTKSALGNFARNEWAIIGTPCGNIQKLAKTLAESITPPRSIGIQAQYKVAYIDADHKAGDEGANLPFDIEYTDKIGYHRLDFAAKMTHFQFRPLFNDADIVLVNGNHFEAKRQIVVLDPKKMESLSKKLNRLTAVDLFLTINTEGGDVPEFLKNHISNWTSIPIFDVSETDKIADFLLSKIHIPPLKALILVGGKSTRMGSDKAFLDYHGKPQYSFLADILRELDIETYISCRAEQADEFIDNQKVITDTFLDLGPYGAILSAFRHDPNAAWLVLACDLPLLDADTLQFLIEKRNTHKLATSFRSPESKEGFPEPLIAIWEPRAYPTLLQFLAQSISCPRKVLINSDIELLTPSVATALMNVNTPEERTTLLTQLQSHIHH